MKTTTNEKTKKSKNTPMGTALIEALTEAIEFKRGAKTGATIKTVSARRATAKPAPAYGAKKIANLRKQLHMSQPLFADVLNVSPAAVKAWEQGQNEPGGATLRLLQIAEAHPDILLEQVRSV